MSEEPTQPDHGYIPPVSAPRISGTAMPTGVFLSSGAYGSGAAWELALAGFAMIVLGALSLIPTYLLLWLADQHLHLSLPSVLLQLGGPVDPVLGALARIGTNVLGFLVFLLVLRFTPLAGYHAAEHMTVHAVEHFGVWNWEPYVAQMPRAHRRCGSNLLAGILPALLIGVPLFHAGSPLFMGLAVLVAVGGWRVRHQVGFIVQNCFTTRPPTAKQLERGMAAARRVLEQWERDPAPRLPVAQVIWGRGLPQMVAGVAIAMYVLGFAGSHLPHWLGW
jgi:hypothetical protein